jgi:predicted ABC-type ATPase
MLNRLQELFSAHKDFAFETTLSTRSSIVLLKQANEKDYTSILLIIGAIQANC